MYSVDDDSETTKLNPIDRTKMSVSIKERRPIALQLEPINTSTFNCDQTDSTSLQISPIKKPLTIGFSDLSYSVKGVLKRGKKTILKNIHGDMKAGELTAIMGPSGAGKSTLLDILAGYTTKDVLGTITVNDCVRDPKKFRRQTAYIMQDNELQPLLSVIEAMYFSCCLKVGDDMTLAEKKLRIKEIIDAIGLKDSARTLTGNLSGGQKKRLAIALELVNNPPVMFFDEPTSGLDSSISTQCVSLLKQLAEGGRTIICTIHQPSALVFKMFDHLYAIAEGECIFSGAIQNMIPFLGELGLKCPEFHNPSDYLLEISTHDYGVENPRLVEKSGNGKCHDFRKSSTNSSQIQALNAVDEMMNRGLFTPVKAPIITLTNVMDETPQTILNVKQKKLGIKLDPRKCYKRDDNYSTSFWRQLFLLLKRTFLILKRDSSLIISRILIHLLVGTLIGLLYLGIGNDAKHVLNNFRYVFFSIMFLMYTAFSAMVLAFPLELPIITREHFNRWYSLKAYYVAMTLSDAPLQIVCILFYTIITFFMTGQPMEFYRYAFFSLICLMVTLVAQSIGLVIGSLFSVKNGAIFGPFFICPFLVFSGFFLQIKDAHLMLHWLFDISFLKYALEGASVAIFGFNRPKMVCNELFCQYILPKKFMTDIEMHQDNMFYAILALFLFFMFFRIIAFYVMFYRLRHKR